MAGVHPGHASARPPRPRSLPAGRRGRSASARSRDQHLRDVHPRHRLRARDASAYVDMMGRYLHQLRSCVIWHHPQKRYILHDPPTSVDTSFSGPP